MYTGQWDTDKCSFMYLFLVTPVVSCLQNLVTVSYIHMYSSMSSPDYAMFNESMVGMFDKAALIKVNVLLI